MNLQRHIRWIWSSQYTSVPLSIWQAIKDNDIDGLRLQLQTGNINVNAPPSTDLTPLMFSLLMNRSRNFIMVLLEAGCTVNGFFQGKFTTLHLAIHRNRTDIVHELIKRGAAINAIGGMPTAAVIANYSAAIAFSTPLHSAVYMDNLETVCMLLYYGADAHVKSCCEISPLHYAIANNLLEIARVLIDHYGNWYYRCSAYDPNVKYEVVGLLLYLFRRPNSADLCKLIWNRSYCETYLDVDDLYKLLMQLAMRSDFPAHVWLQWINLLWDLVFQHPIKACKDFEFFKFFENLLCTFYLKKIEKADRIRIIYNYLSVGALVTPEDCKRAYMLYGFGEEFEALVYADGGNFTPDAGALAFFIAPTKADYDAKLIDELHELVRAITPSSTRHWLYRKLNSTVIFSGRFSLSAATKRKVKSLFWHLLQDVQQTIFEKLDRVPELPSLKELNRDKVRLDLIQARDIKYLYHFCDKIKLLGLPKVLKDELLLKKPIYF